MGFADRDYYRSPSRAGGLGYLRGWSVTTWLIAINIAVYLIDRLMGGALTEWGAFSLATAVWQWQAWRFITFQFLHYNPSHILFNMIGLYFFGPIIENYFGSRRYLAFYLLCGISGALSCILLNYVGLLRDGPYTGLVGASAGIYGILVAAGLVAPDVQVMLLFPPIPMRLRTMAWVCIGIAVYTVLSAGNNAGGQAAHLGGALVGFLLVKNERLLNFADWGGSGMKFGGKRVRIKDWSKDPNR